MIDLARAGRKYVLLLRRVGTRYQAAVMALTGMSHPGETSDRLKVCVAKPFPAKTDRHFVPCLHYPRVLDR